MTNHEILVVKNGSVNSTSKDTALRKVLWAKKKGKTKTQGTRPVSNNGLVGVPLSHDIKQGKK